MGHYNGELHIRPDQLTSGFVLPSYKVSIIIIDEGICLNVKGFLASHSHPISNHTVTSTLCPAFGSPNDPRDINMDNYVLNQTNLIDCLSFMFVVERIRDIRTFQNQEMSRMQLVRSV